MKYSILGLGLLLAATLAGCQDTYDAPELQDPQATLTPNTTIAEFKSLFGDELAVQTPYKDADTQTPYIIHGRVISSDASGNIYKSLVIQDETGAIAFSVNQGSMYTTYRLGQEIVVDTHDLWIGQYNSYIQFGSLGEYNGNPQITFMAYDTFKRHAEMNGFPNQNFVNVRLGDQASAANPYCVVATLSELANVAAYSDEYYYLMGQLVEIPNVRFKDAGKTPAVTFSTYQENADRNITDDSGAELNVRCSGYSSFYNTPLPTGTGTVRGILSRYGENWQLLLRGLDDVMFDAKGTVSEPLTVEEAISMNNNMRNAWVEGYIVGSVKTISGDATEADIIYGSEATENDNNIVLAPTADCRDFSKLMVVQLPADSKIREYANLLDNEDVLGKVMRVNGNLNKYLGMPGITEIRSDYTCFQIDGVYIPGSEFGMGIEDKPYLPQFFVQNPGAVNSVWVEGYIVGGINTADIATGAIFDLETLQNTSSYVGNNFILGATRTTTSVNECIPVMLKGDWRKAYGLKDNPDKFGLHVKMKVNVASTSYKAYGVTEILDIQELED